MKTDKILSERYAKYNRPQALQHYIKSQDLTLALTLLSQAGYSDELAIFILAYTQSGLEAAV